MKSKKYKAKFGIVVFPGSNCDQDCHYVVENVLDCHASYVWHRGRRLDGYDCLILPGGFSYGDYLKAGAIARFSPVMKPICDFAKKGGLVIGICNGFQILLESGLLPGAMLRNRNIHFICKNVYIRVEENRTPFTHLCDEGQVLKIPIAHNEGKYYIDKAGYRDLEKNGQIVFRYCSKEGEADDNFNPNGALDNIAGIANKEGNVLGMMPHPERSAEYILDSTDGLMIFNSITRWVDKRL